MTRRHVIRAFLAVVWVAVVWYLTEHFFFPPKSMRAIDDLLRKILTGVCGWEFVALTTKLIPTLSAVVWCLIEEDEEVRAALSPSRPAPEERLGTIAVRSWLRR